MGFALGFGHGSVRFRVVFVFRFRFGFVVGLFLFRFGKNASFFLLVFVAKRGDDLSLPMPAARDVVLWLQKLPPCLWAGSARRGAREDDGGCVHPERKESRRSDEDSGEEVMGVGVGAAAEAVVVVAMAVDCCC